MSDCSSKFERLEEAAKKLHRNLAVEEEFNCVGMAEDELIVYVTVSPPSRRFVLLVPDAVDDFPVSIKYMGKIRVYTEPF